MIGIGRARLRCVVLDQRGLEEGGISHVRDDIPALVDALRKRCPNAAISLGSAAGENAGVIEALATFSLAELNPR